MLHCENIIVIPRNKDINKHCIMSVLEHLSMKICITYVTEIDIKAYIRLMIIEAIDFLLLLFMHSIAIATNIFKCFISYTKPSVHQTFFCILNYFLTNQHDFLLHKLFRLLKQRRDQLEW